jgi:hypothetical protein
VKIDSSGKIIFNIDLDIARKKEAKDPELLINPMVAATSRLAYGDQTLALVHGINTDPDSGGVRHQKAITTHLSATNGAILKASSIWVSHSFDQRVFHDGNGFIETHLGDAYPRTIAFARTAPDSGAYSLFHIKGSLGENNTRTRLGNVVPIENDATWGYLGLFVSESTTTTTPLNEKTTKIAGPRNVAVARVRKNFENYDKSGNQYLDQNLPDSLTVDSKGTLRTNPVRFLTHYTASSEAGSHAERPKLVPIANNTFIVLWERWDQTDASFSFMGVYGMIIDKEGTPTKSASLITNQHHLHRGDDAFRLANRGCWMTGNGERQELELHCVDSTLTYKKEIIQ